MRGGRVVVLGSDGGEDGGHGSRGAERQEMRDKVGFPSLLLVERL